MSGGAPVQSSMFSQLAANGIFSGGGGPPGSDRLLVVFPSLTYQSPFTLPTFMSANAQTPFASLFNGGVFNPKGQGLLQKVVASIREDFAKMGNEGHAVLSQSAAAAQSMIGAGVHFGGDVMSAGSGLSRMASSFVDALER